MGKSTKNSPTTNIPIQCPLCDLYIFKYLMNVHYGKMHKNHPFPNIYNVADDEKKLIIDKLKYLTKTNDKIGPKYAAYTSLIANIDNKTNPDIPISRGLVNAASKYSISNKVNNSKKRKLSDDDNDTESKKRRLNDDNDVE